MSVAASDLIDPAGPLTTSLFPGDDMNALTARVNAYFAAAASDKRVAAIVGADSANADAAAEAYALWRAYRAVVQRMNSEPITVRLNDGDKGSHGYSVSQIAAMQALVDSYDAQLAAMLPAQDTPVATMSQGIPNTFSW
jgi:hypothetical protein